MTDYNIRIRLNSADAERGIDKLDGGMRSAGRSADGLNSALSRVASAVAAALSVRQIVAFADEFTNLQNKLRIVTGSTEELARVTATLLQVANDTRSGFEATATLFSRLQQSTTELGVSQERLVRITELVNKSFAVSGATTVEASNAIRQLSQGFASGTLRGEEFNSVAEQAPVILRAVAKETGKAFGELREFAAQGGITAELLIRSVENYADTVEKEYAKTNRTFEQSTTIARNNAVAFIGANELVQQATQAAGDSIVFLSENLQAVGQTFTLIAGVIAGKYLISLGQATQAAVANTLATANNTIAARTQAQVEFFAANSIRVKTVALQQATIAQTAYAASARAATAAFSLLAGPAGLILLAASALLIFSSNSSKARKESEALDAEINKLVNNFKDLNEEGKALTFKKLANEQVSLLKQITEADNAVVAAQQRVTDAARNSGGRLTAASNQAAEAVLSAKRRVEDLNSKLDKVVDTQKKLFEVGLPSDNSFTNGLKEIGEAAETTFEQLRKVSSGINQIFEGDFNLFGDSAKEPKDDSAQQERINSRIAGLRLETETLATETELQRQVRLGAITSELAELQLQTTNRVNNAITERDLILAEKGITDGQIAEAEMAFQENMLAISEQYAEQRVAVSRMELSQRISQFEGYAAASLSLADAFGSKSEKSQKKRRKQSVIISTAAGIARAYADNDFYSGSVIAGLVALNGIAQIRTIENSSSGSISSGGLGSAAVPQPTIPESQQQVNTLEIVGIQALTDELRNLGDQPVPATYVAKILEAIPSAQRLRGEG